DHEDTGARARATPDGDRSSQVDPFVLCGPGLLRNGAEPVSDTAHVASRLGSLDQVAIVVVEERAVLDGIHRGLQRLGGRVLRTLQGRTSGLETPRECGI